MKFCAVTWYHREAPCGQSSVRSLSRPLASWQRKVGTGLFVFLLSVALVPSAKAQDAQGVLQKMVKAYTDLSSYDGTANVDTRILYKDKPLQERASTARMQIKRPNKFHLDITSPQGGREIYSDGKAFFVYDTLNHQYIRSTAPADMQAMLTLLLQRAGISANLDPLYFMGMKVLPKELSGFKLKSDTLNGHPVFVVTGTTHTAPLTVKTKSGKSVTIPSATRYWTWWVDKTTYLMHKMESRSTEQKMQVGVRQGKKVVPTTIPVIQVIRNSVVEVKPNAPLADNLFTFIPPQGATERRSVEEIIKGGK